MIIGVGVDIVKVERIKKSINRTESFLTKVFTEKEVDYFKKKNNNYETIAGYFAAKEAVSKALGTGIRGFRLTDIEICNDYLGKPEIHLSEKIKKLNKLEAYKAHLSISHTSEDAIAFVVLEGGVD